MSGGSYEYASINAGDSLEDFCKYRSQLAEMADRLYGYDWDSQPLDVDDVAADLESLLAYVQHVEQRVLARFARLQPILQDLEWWQSGDRGPENVRESARQYREVK